LNRRPDGRAAHGVIGFKALEEVKLWIALWIKAALRFEGDAEPGNR